MKGQAGDTATRQNALGALQKFSLRREPQTVMIRHGCVEWIIGILNRHVVGKSVCVCGTCSAVGLQKCRVCTMMLVLTVMCTTTAMGTGGQGEMLSEYSVEYSTALLMNLSLRTEGKARAAKEEVGVGRLCTS